MTGGSSPRSGSLASGIGATLLVVVLSPIWVPCALIGMFAAFTTEMVKRGWYVGGAMVKWMDSDA